MAERRISHPASDELFAASKGDRTLSNLVSVLGPPQMPQDFNVEDRLAHERWPVEKLFEGQQVYLENQLSTMVMRTHNPWVTDLIMPLRQYQAITFAWTKWHANRTLAAQSPVGAPPERVTQQRTRFRTTMNRYQLGFIVNAETLDNPEGEFALALDLVNVAVAIADTFEQLGLTALLQRKNYHRERLRKYHEPYGDAADIFFWEKFFWDILRKDPSGRGFYTMAEEVKKAQREIISSDVIMPEGAKSLLASGYGNQDYYYFGAGARMNVERGLDNVGTSVATALRVHVVREFTVDRSGVRVAPLHRIKSIGDHFRLEDYAADCSPAEYRRCARTAKVFDMSESRGVFKPVDLMYAIRHSERFQDDGGEEGGPLKKSPHDDLAANADVRFGQQGLRMPSDGFVDMFIYQEDGGTGYRTAKVFGQMEDAALPYSTVRAVAETMAARISETVGRTLLNEVDAGNRLINKLYNKAIGRPDLDFLRSAAEQAQSSSGVDSGVIGGNEYGSHDLPEMPNLAAGSYLPAGYGSVSGMYAIAGSNASYIPEHVRETAQRYVDAVDVLHSSMASMVDKFHVGFSHAATPAHFQSSHAKGSRAQRRQDSKITFAQNFIDSAKSPLIMQTSGASVSSSQTSPSQELQRSIIAELTGAGLDADESAVIDSMRKAASQSATAQTVNAFKDADATTSFAERYAASEWAHAYSRYEQQRAGATSAEKSAARSNRKLSLFAKSWLRRSLDAGSVASTASIASVINGVVDAVERESPVSSRNVETMLANWSRSATSSRSSAAAAGAAEGSLVTRLVVSPTMMSRAVRTHSEAGDWSVAHRNGGLVDLTSRSDVAVAEEPDRPIDRLFAHSATPILARSGAERRTAGIGGGYRGRAGNAPAGVPTAGLVAANISPNNNLDNKYDLASEERDTLVQLAARVVLLAPISYSTLERFYVNDVRVPVSVLAERPNRRYEAASCIFAAGGEQLGEIAWSRFDVHLGSNAMTKDLEGNATVWAAAIIKREERYFIAEDVLVTRYLGGESLKPYSKNTFTPATLDRDSASVFYLMVPYGSLRGPEAVPKTHDIRGYFNPDLIEQRLTEQARGLVVDRPHYSSALYYSRMYGFNNFETLSQDDADYFRVDGVHDNTVTHQTQQYNWNAKTGQSTDIIQNTDHFGKHGVYEGAGDLRVAGAAQHYEKQDFKFIPVD
jgi:hypothetical protein